MYVFILLLAYVFWYTLKNTERNMSKYFLNRAQGLSGWLQTVASAWNGARRSRERAGGLERPPAPHCAAEETSPAFHDVGLKWQKQFLWRKRTDPVT